MTKLVHTNAQDEPWDRSEGRGLLCTSLIKRRVLFVFQGFPGGENRFLCCLATAVVFCCTLPRSHLFACVCREEEAIQLDGLNAAQIKEIREKSEKHAFQAEVNRMMKLIINSLYKNKEVSIK